MKPFQLAREASSTFVTNKPSATNKSVQIGQAIRNHPLLTKRCPRKFDNLHIRFNSDGYIGQKPDAYRDPAPPEPVPPARPAF